MTISETTALVPVPPTEVEGRVAGAGWMRLWRLLADVPKDIGPVVDPFMGSGTTGIACIQTGHDFIGIEREKEYLTIAEGRVRHWNTREAGWNAAVVESDLTEITEAQEAEPQTISLDDLFGL